MLQTGAAGLSASSIVNTLHVAGRIAVGDNPNDMALSKDGRLFASSANENTVTVIDTKTRQVIERISTALTPNFAGRIHAERRSP